MGNENFIEINGITKGIIIDDKGFPECVAHHQFEVYPNLHYLNPIKRNSKLIETHHLLEMTEYGEVFEPLSSDFFAPVIYVKINWSSRSK